MPGRGAGTATGAAPGIGRETAARRLRVAAGRGGRPAVDQGGDGAMWDDAVWDCAVRDGAARAGRSSNVCMMSVCMPTMAP